ncbi:MAG: DegT/DnrJ/EryC1/StrS family aminotransferase, partial [Actinomycetota bacterium]|nr:DegT/DnrJ/EryC1/StrS family aminotransferase [Actinomycetota bacterium]
RLTTLCSSHRIAFIEDAAQAHGATWSGRSVGSWGIGAFSFYPTKNMTTGEGGMLTTSDEEVAAGARSFADHGRVPSSSQAYVHPQFGLNFRLSDLAASIGRVQLRKLATQVGARRELASRLRAVVPRECTQKVPEQAEHAYNLFPIIAPDRDTLAARLRSQGIPTGIFYPAPPYGMGPYLPSGDCPRAEEAAGRLICLRIGALSETLMDQYVERVGRVMEG